ncbi:MAG TPA: hypothetical protein VFK06_05545 [Candidatus Angelobacter sp.]|nr:hypothetical protein [Candidatus Angelobacter sp.]
MTIGIGVLASDPHDTTIKPNHLVLLADTMGSFDDEYSHARLHKLFAFPENDLYVAAADQIDVAAALVPMINFHVSQAPEATRSHGDIGRAIAQAVFLFRSERFIMTVFPKYGLPPGSIAPDALISASSLIAGMALAPEDVREKIQQEWENFNIGCDLLVGAFNCDGYGCLFSLYGQDVAIHTRSFPGFWAIGSGGENAKFWLSYRAHTLGMGLKRSAYHAYESKVMAESSAKVNEHLDMIVATKGKHWHQSTHRPSDKSDCPVTFDDFRKYWDIYGPKETESIELRKLSPTSSP